MSEIFDSLLEEVRKGYNAQQSYIGLYIEVGKIEYNGILDLEVAYRMASLAYDRYLDDIIIGGSRPPT